MARIGVFICHCGHNIAGSVDIAKVVEAAKAMPGVAYATDYLYCCSEPGQAIIRQAIKENRLTRVVVGACSPRMHEKTFQGVLASAGLNPFLLEMANLREQCSWVHSDAIEEATEKAIDLIRMAVAKASRAEPLFSKPIPVTKRALVVGGGIAGMQAALDIANAGFEVVLVEREPTIGGKMAKFDKTFPTLDCASCILTPRMVELAKHPRIRLMTYAEVEEVKGYPGNFEARIRQRARKVDHSKCTGCGTCWQKCPTKVPSEFDLGLGKRTAIYIPFPQAVPPKPVIDTANCRYMAYLEFVRGGGEGKPPPQCRICERLCPTGAINWDEEDQIITERFGAIVVATGYELFDPSRIPQYGYGRLDNVVTSLEFERILNASGPTGGRILLRDGREPKRVAIVHCVGSRDLNYNEHCSKVCCMYSMKYAHLIRERIPDAEVYEFYIDVRSAGKGFEEFYNRVLEEGVRFVRGRVAEISKGGNGLLVRFEDTLGGTKHALEVDMAILACGLVPQRDAEEVARIFKLSRSPDGFFLEKHPKLDPVNTHSDGIFLAGACIGPCDIPDAVAKGSAAAAKAIGLLAQDSILSEPMTAIVDMAKCSGCMLCEEVCPFDAIEPQVVRGRRVARVSEELCKGCGSCAAACRSGAINLRGFTHQQLLAEVEAL
ncbi:MAG: CoB--CoM heterodisulfide reductase iron-sulfur subunit A family protein [Candidatus Bathyarchaeia archaeon]